MQNATIRDAFSKLSTALVSDACVRLGVPYRLAPTSLKPLVSGTKVSGRVVPVRHYGSADIFLEAISMAQQGEVLVVDNGGRMNEGCLGDLIVLEAQAAGLGGIIIWGCHRDTTELMELGLPLFSMGACPVGPGRLEPREADAFSSACLQYFAVGRNAVTFADDDGILFVPHPDVERVMTAAHAIWETERRQAVGIKFGKSLREQLKFQDYLEKSAANPAYTFRVHLREIGAALESSPTATGSTTSS